MRWVFEVKKRFGLSVLDYMVTCNHVHLLIKDTGPNVIARSMQLMLAAPVKNITSAKGGTAFWVDRYHATVIETDEHLHHCLVYIELNIAWSDPAHRHFCAG